ncbi:hypothetical protein GQ53DRAFT_806349 [Thozetella sp. PMI_491]|nr:hypothetical protein GQ53DRAFT_806349 [Thozetella sp. PMI_491]
MAVATLSYADIPAIGHLDAGGLANTLNGLDSKANCGVAGRLLIVEDPSPGVIELLGLNLGIDPLFFASYIHTPSVDITVPRPSTALLPSNVRSRSFLSLQYYRPIELTPEPGVISKKMRRYCNIPRKVVILPVIKNKRIALLQHGCSVMITHTKDNAWLGLVLADSPLSHVYTSPERQLIIPSRLFQGGYEDFTDTPEQVAAPSRSSILDDLVFYWKQAQPPNFNQTAPTLFSLAYYPLKIIAAEWMSLVDITSNCLKVYEYSSSGNHDDITKLDSDLLSLQGWSRRCMQNSHKLHAAIKFLQALSVAGTDLDEEAHQRVLLTEDFKHIDAMLGLYSARLEAMVPVVTSLVQIGDARRSLSQGKNVNRLTLLALLFVPLAFVSGILSMSDEAPNSTMISLYFEVAIPITIGVYCFASLPSVWKAIGSLGGLVSKRRHRA